MLLRRFDPENRKHYDIDQAGPERPPSLRAGFLRFDRYPEGETELPPVYFGCSVFRDAVLEEMCIPRSHVLLAQYVGLAGITAEDARATGAGSNANPVDAIADPQPSVESDGSDTYQAAHALITLTPMSRGQRDKFITKICRRMRVIWVRP